MPWWPIVLVTYWPNLPFRSSDQLQVGMRWPQNLSSALAAGALCASLDGDADRIVFYFGAGSASGQSARSPTPAEAAKPTATHLVLLDGDYIAALLAGFAQKTLLSLPGAESMSVGVPAPPLSPMAGPLTHDIAPKCWQTPLRRTWVQHACDGLNL
jgi:hypothetical protein